MNITFNEETKIFHIQNEHISYVIGVLQNDHLAHFYFGKKLEGPLHSSQFRVDQNKGLTSNVFEGNSSFSLNNEMLEYPCFGTTDFREPAIDIERLSGSQIVDFKYSGYAIVDDKPRLKHLPSTYGERSQTLQIFLIDDVAKLMLTLSYTVFDGLKVITRNTELQNLAEEHVYIQKLMSLNIDLPDSNWEMMQFSGDWARERELYTTKLRPGLQGIYSNRGASSANHNPSMILKREQTTEHTGEAIGISFVYSGNFMIQAEVDSNNIVRLMTGISPSHFKWKLKGKESFQSPEAILSYTDQGLGDLSHQFHHLIRDHLIHKKWRNSVRPIVLNNWEATYFDFNEDKIVALAKEGAELGIELFVLDDGWFGDRNGDQTGLGDWFVNTTKLPNGIEGLSKRIHKLGMKFGLWIEPEMINKSTQLMKQHPDYLIGDPERKISHGRNQYVLDFSRDDVVENIFEQLTKVLDPSDVDYIKWDMNKNITEAYSESLGPQQQGEVYHRYILGVYKLYDKLIERYPKILIESCASGGGRFDLGMMYYAPQAWTSDNTDAVERLKIQHATSMIYPLVTMGSHVSAVPNHQVVRMTSLEMRGEVANFGTFGYELDVTVLSEDDKKIIKEQIKHFSGIREMIHYGEFYRLISPFDGYFNNTAWQVISKDRKETYVAWFQVLARPNQEVRYLKLTGLRPEQLYEVSGLEYPMSGSLLMNQGIMLQTSFNGVERLDFAIGDYQSRSWLIKEI